MADTEREPEQNDLPNKNTRSDDDPIEGSCLCGGVLFRARGPLGEMGRCYCSQCRKASGAEFATNANVEEGSFELARGEDLLREFESSPGQMRVFCGRCGSPLFKRYVDAPKKIRLRLGCVDTPIHQRPLARIFVGSKFAFSEAGQASEDIPNFETSPGA